MANDTQRAVRPCLQDLSPTCEDFMTTTDLEGRMTARCVHFYVFPPPDGPMSTGVCKYCGTTREFRNSFESSPVNPYIVGKVSVLPKKPDIGWTENPVARERPLKTNRRPRWGGLDNGE